MQKSAFWPALLTGMAAPVSLYAAPQNYMAYIPGPAESFYATGTFLAAAWALQVEAVRAATPTVQEKDAKPAAADRSIESAT